MTNTLITIKKYPNRRLYNTKKSAYITLEDVSDLIKEGFRIIVVDVTTGNDVTPLVLSQVILNKAKEDNAILPVSLLHLVIQYGESHLHDPIQTSLGSRRICCLLAVIIVFMKYDFYTHSHFHRKGLFF